MITSTLNTLHGQDPMIIQGGMGIGVSGWELAKAVSRVGQLGVISGTALDQVFARKLQMGDPNGHYRRAMSFFPDLEMIRRIEDTFYLPMGKPIGRRFKAPPMFTFNMPNTLKELTVVAAFSEVFLAKEGHEGPIGMNLLEKVQLPNLFAIYGAMLAGIDYVFMGAGIPNEIPGIIDRLTRHLDVSLKIDVEGASPADRYRLAFSPKAFLPKEMPTLKRPKFVPIISSATLAKMMRRKANGMINGFVVETSSAGGHNAPPRGKLFLTAEGEPIYSSRDDVEIEKIQKLGLPFWLAGSWCSPEKLKKAIGIGAQGIQAGTAFAFCKEASVTERLKKQIIQCILKGKASVFTDAKASPTDFPFKVLSLKGTLSEKDAYQHRKRICDLGYLRNIYKKLDGSIGYRCPAEPVDAYLHKGGRPELAENRKCLCNALLSNIGLGQCRSNGAVENTLITAGKAILSIARVIKDNYIYTAEDVVNWLLSEANS